MKTLAKVVVGCVVLGSVTVANQGCGCGPIQGAYFTPAVLRYAPQGWVDAPGLLRPRSFATVIPLDDENYLVAGGFIAERDGDAADDAHTIELCSIVSGCVAHGETPDTNEAESFDVPRPGAGYLPDGTVITSSFVVRPNGANRHVLTPAHYSAVVQLGMEVVVQEAGAVYVLGDGTSPPRKVATYPAHSLAMPLTGRQVLMVSKTDTFALDVDTGAVVPGPGPGPGARAEYPIGDGARAIVLGEGDVFLYVAATKTWRTIPALAGGHWNVELPLVDGAILSSGDPDPEAQVPYHLVRYDLTKDTVTPLPETPAFDLGATWVELPSGEILRIGGAKTWFDTIASLASG